MVENQGYQIISLAREKPDSSSQKHREAFPALVKKRKFICTGNENLHVISPSTIDIIVPMFGYLFLLIKGTDFAPTRKDFSL
uniref:Uncharacterized protein n=1 Tax=Candidatus Kentrum sp. MB TaxID=2138164 RepID=A0A450XDU4_9GAMM|nr:MAG: hypothetical protein BECKMB1821G_GA0114241_10284 [Candidatus Kentron sp. MB]VFK32013.1 MAG: hypothetical protein BECKMB1821I_GA0114274_10293 [Candidatus Kentron sp. MB]VFK75680.1 MAG: hypothetical protein BECKMB1821H_GA0114242_102845 [Candidatus Kentron sp. MB]